MAHPKQTVYHSVFDYRVSVRVRGRKVSQARRGSDGNWNFPVTFAYLIC